ncbi:MAG: hypothetical protein AAGB28_19480 [Pseudomonadota bacterium]
MRTLLQRRSPRANDMRVALLAGLLVVWAGVFGLAEAKGHDGLAGLFICEKMSS